MKDEAHRLTLSFYSRGCPRWEDNSQLCSYRRKRVGRTYQSTRKTEISEVRRNAGVERRKQGGAKERKDWGTRSLMRKEGLTRLNLLFKLRREYSYIHLISITYNFVVI